MTSLASPTTRRLKTSSPPQGRAPNRTKIASPMNSSIACVLADADGDMIFSTFDTRDLDKSQPDMKCGTHIITGGTGKYNGITGSEPFDCNALPALAGSGGYTSMDIPHNTSWEIK